MAEALKIGPTFRDEIAAAGISLDGLAWNAETGEIVAADSDDQRAAAESVLAKHDPNKAIPVITRVDKVDIWRRTTDAEAQQLVALLDQQPVRLQRMFNDATVISSADEMWPTLLGGITQLLGSDRAAVVLAAS